MLDYKYQKETTDYAIIENRTGNTVMLCSNQDEAKTMTKHLNFGGGFAGHTPQFIAVDLFS